MGNDIAGWLKSPFVLHAALIAGILASACGSNPSNKTSAAPNPPKPKPGDYLGGVPNCTATASTETSCDNGGDEDCDGAVDCGDEDCAGQSCGSNGLSCTEARCALPGKLDPLPPLTNVEVKKQGDSVVIRFMAGGALDYRIYEMPDPARITPAADGSITITDAVYRCAGDRPMSETQGQLGGDVMFYERPESDAMLGYVYPSAGPGRIPVFQLGDPNADSDTAEGTQFMASRVHRLTTDVNERATMLSQGFRDDGVAFYAPESGGDRKLYGLVTPPQGWIQDRIFNLVYPDGAEREERNDQGTEKALFDIFASETPGTLPLYRVLYPEGNFHDELGVGVEARERLLNQGNRAFNELHWAGLTGKTTLVIEALDKACPFQGLLAPTDTVEIGYAQPFKAPATVASTSTAGQIFVNGQGPAANVPVPVARSFVSVEPAPAPSMDFYADFVNSGTGQVYEVIDSDSGAWTVHSASELFDLDFIAVEEESLTVGELFGQFWVGYADNAADTNGKFRLAAKQLATLASDSYLHVTAEMMLPSTLRRYPQILVSTLTPPVQRKMPEGTTVIVQPFGATTYMQLQLCKNRVWDVNNQCPMAKLTRDLGTGAYSDQSPWPPQPVVTESAAFDRLVKIDAYYSTSKVYVFFDDQPYGCGVLPASSWAAGEVSVSIGDVLYHSGVDEEVICSGCAHQFLNRSSLPQMVRKFDSFGFKSGVAQPAWDDAVLPCGSWN